MVPAAGLRQRVEAAGRVRWMTVREIRLLGCVGLAASFSQYECSWEPVRSRRRWVSMGAEKRSVGDYMGGVHAGKYEFDSRFTGVTSINYEKSIVAGDMATGVRRILAKLDNADVKPVWAERDVDLEMENAFQGTIDGNSIGVDAVNGFGVILRNDEISWEPFYTQFLTIDGKEGGEGREKGGVGGGGGEIMSEGKEERMSSGSGNGLQILEDSTFLLTPANGTLAPRGGAQNACDASKPYSDSCVLTVYRPPREQRQGALGGGQDVWLVVRTEQDHWSWRITPAGVD